MNNEEKIIKLEQDLENKKLAIKNRNAEIKLLGERCNQLLKDKGDLTDRCRELEQENNKLFDVINNQDVKIADLEQQIEKMKCCDNCANEDREDFYDDTWHNDVCVNCKNHDKWELKK